MKTRQERTTRAFRGPAKCSAYTTTGVWLSCSGIIASSTTPVGSWCNHAPARAAAESCRSVVLPDRAPRLITSTRSDEPAPVHRPGDDPDRRRRRVLHRVEKSFRNDLVGIASCSGVTLDGFFSRSLETTVINGDDTTPGVQQRSEGRPSRSHRRGVEHGRYLIDSGTRLLKACGVRRIVGQEDAGRCRSRCSSPLAVSNAVRESEVLSRALRLACATAVFSCRSATRRELSTP